MASICNSSASSIRATGIPYWRDLHHAAHRVATVGNVHAAATVAGGIGWSGA